MQSNVTLLSYCVIEGLFFAGHCKFPELRLLHLPGYEDRVVTVYINTSVKHTSSMNALRLSSRPLTNKCTPTVYDFYAHQHILCKNSILCSLCKKGLLTLLTKVQKFFFNSSFFPSLNWLNSRVSNIRTFPLSTEKSKWVIPSTCLAFKLIFKARAGLA